MGGDYSRKSFDALRDFASVMLQQGHPTLDADWNEFAAIFERRLRAETVDVIGRAVVPRETPTGFQVVAAAGPTLSIGRGRMYVDGLLAENHGRIGAGAPPIFDRAREIDDRPAGVLDEMISREPGDFVSYAAQPYLPAPPPLPAGAGPHLVYLDVWQREVTPLKDPRLLEPALGGIDTATRLQTVWQVRVLADVGAGTTCATDVAAFDAVAAPSAARLTTATIEYEDPDEPCLIPPGGGYRGLENQLYRVEIHAGTGLANARFKWSRENASVGATVESFEAPDRLRVRRIGRDSVLRFHTGDWVEITDDRREFAGRSGDIRRVEVDDDANELLLSAPLSADLVSSGNAGDTAAARHSRVVRWDQGGEVMLANGDPWTDLDDAGSDGLIPVPTDGSAVVLEAGITVAFAAEPAGGVFRPLDHWCFAARTADASIEILAAAPPHGIHHHCARLAVVTFPATVVDCRIFWPPEFGEDGCACTECVSAEEHNAGVLTIQAAIDRLPPEGGTVCLGPGDFVLGDTPVEIVGRTSVRLVGHGPGTLLAYGGAGGAVRVTGSLATRLEDFAVVVAGSRDPTFVGVDAGFHLRNCQEIELTRVAAAVLSPAAIEGVGLALDGVLLRPTARDNVFFAAHGIAALADPQRGDGPGYCLLYDARIDDNTLIAARRGVSLDGAVVHLAATRIAGNAVAAGEAGIVVTGAASIDDGDDGDDVGEADGVPLASLAIVGNTVFVGPGGDGIVSGFAHQRILDNNIRLDAESVRDLPPACIRLVEGLLPGRGADSEIVGNRIGRSAGVGIAIDAPQGILIVKRNVIERCALGAVVAAAEAGIETLALDNNVFDRIAGRPGDTFAAVRLVGLVEARVIGNVFRRIGLDALDARFVAALYVRGALVVDVSHNSFAEIGPPNGGRSAFAMRFEAPIVVADISANRVVGLEQRDDGAGGSFTAIALDGRLGGDDDDRLPAAGGYPAYVAVGAATMSLSRRGVATFAVGGEANLRLDGNLVVDARERGEQPLVFVRGDVGGGTCGFSGNQCRLDGNGAMPSLVHLEARRLIVANNAVRRESDADAVHLFSGALFERASATVLGNITFGNIRLNGGDVPAPFDELNILG